MKTPDWMQNIAPKSATSGGDAAWRSLREFDDQFGATLATIKDYLDSSVSKLSAEFAAGYHVWQDLLGDLIQGVKLAARRILPPEPERLLMALKAFSLESAVAFLRDLCACCNLEIPRDWAERFRQQVTQALTAHVVLMQQQATIIAR